MHFEHDIFISYAPATGADNKTTTDWTLKFCEYLSLLMHRLGGRKPVIMLHDDLRVRRNLLGEGWQEALRKTSVFIIVLSPEYAQSAEYLRELEEICDTVYSSGTAVSGIHRVFKVMTLPVSLSDQPECLRAELNYNFFEFNRFNKKPVTFELDSKTGSDDKFWSRLVDLAYDISEVLLQLKGTPGGNGVSPASSLPSVFLAETSFDQQENHDMLKRELRHLGYNVLPMMQLPEDAEKGKNLIHDSLKRSFAAIHLLGAWYGEFLKNSKYSLIDFQIKTVKDYLSLKDAPTKPHQFIWMPNDLKPTDQRQSLYLKRLKRDESQYLTEIIETPFEVFKTILNARLNDIVQPKPKPAAEKNRLYMIYDASSSEKLSPYVHQIRKRGFDVVESVLSNGESHPVSAHITRLLTADAVMIYKGDSNMEWLNSKIRDLVKAPGYGKSKPFRAVEIISPQKTADKSLLFLKSVPVNWDEEISPEVVNHFLDHLLKK